MQNSDEYQYYFFSNESHFLTNLGFESFKENEENQEPFNRFYNSNDSFEENIGISFPYSLPSSPFNLNDKQNDNGLINNDNSTKYTQFLQKKRELDTTLNTKKDTKLGRKKQNDLGEIGEHNKYSDDNLIRKIKGFLINNILDFINHKIEKVYGNIFKLLKINQKQRKESLANYNKNFLNKKLKDIFSDDISTKYKKYQPNYNRNLIRNLLNEEDNEKKNIFEKLFNFTFLDCLKHYRSSEYIEELEGLKLLEDSFKDFKENDIELNKQYLELYVNNFEIIINQKKQRKSRKS